MKQLKKLDLKLFKELKTQELKTNLSTIIGGEVVATSGSVNFSVGNTIYTKRYTDKQDCVMKDGKIISGGCCYGFVFTDGRLLEPRDPEYVDAVFSFDEEYNYLDR